MRASSIKYLVLFGLIGAWVAHKRKGRAFTASADPSADESDHTLASLVREVPPAPYQKTPTAENPFPPNNPSLVSNGAAPGG